MNLIFPNIFLFATCLAYSSSGDNSELFLSKAEKMYNYKIFNFRRLKLLKSGSSEIFRNNLLFNTN